MAAALHELVHDGMTTFIYKAPIQLVEDVDSNTGFETSPTVKCDTRLLFVGSWSTVPDIKGVLLHATAENATTWIEADGNRRLHKGNCVALADEMKNFEATGHLSATPLFRMITQELAINDTQPSAHVHDDADGASASQKHDGCDDTLAFVLVHIQPHMRGCNAKQAFGYALAKACAAESMSWVRVKLMVWFTDVMVEAAFSEAMRTSCGLIDGVTEWSTVEYGIRNLQNILGYRERRADERQLHIKLAPAGVDASLLIASIIAKCGLVYNCRCDSDGALSVSVPMPMLEGSVMVIAGTYVAHTTPPFQMTMGSARVPGSHFPWISAGTPDSDTRVLLDDVTQLASPSTSFRAYYSPEGRIVGSAMLNALHARLSMPWRSGVALDVVCEGETQLARTASTGGGGCMPGWMRPKG